MVYSPGSEGMSASGVFGFAATAPCRTGEAVAVLLDALEPYSLTAIALITFSETPDFSNVIRPGGSQVELDCRGGGDSVHELVFTQSPFREIDYLLVGESPSGLPSS
jgi:hypothetical protein